MAKLLGWITGPLFIAFAFSSVLPPLLSPNHAVRSDDVGSLFFKGFDLSSSKIMEHGGAAYKNTAKGNVIMPVEDMLEGMNIVRLRLWVDPTEPYDGGYYETYNLKYVLGLAKRFYAKGFHIYLDYHFSNYWADPTKQWQPTEWPKTLGPLSTTLRNYVKRTILCFKQHGIDLMIVSLGNEIRNGMLWPLGEVDVNIEPAAARIANFSKLATLYTAARNGAHDAVVAGAHKAQVMIHIDDGWNRTLQERWFSSLTGTGKVMPDDWGVFGFSFYPFYGTSATLANLKNSLNFIAKKYNKPVQSRGDGLAGYLQWSRCADTE